MKIAIWDTPGQIHFRKMWIKKVGQAKVLIFVLDVSDNARFDESKQELDDFIQGLFNIEAPMLLLYHKIDLPEAQANLEKAKAIFEGLDFINEVIPMETTIKKPETLDNVRAKIVEVLKSN